MKSILFIAGLACAVAFPASATAQTASIVAKTGHAAARAAQPPAKPMSPPADQKKPMKPEAGALTAADRAFVMEAAHGGMAEVSLGRIAADKAASPDVKQFGQRMVDDHGKANDELKSWATQKNITLPAELDATSKTTEARLSKLSGAAFDRAYMSDMVMDHNKDVAAFQRASGTAKDPDLKAWIDKTLPTLQDHQKSAKDISAKLKAAK